MALFKFTSNRVEVGRELSLLAPFNEINECEDSDKLFAYIFHMYDWTSPYSTQNEDERETNLKNELFDGEDPPIDLTEAIELYKQLNTTDSLELLQSARKAVRKLREYFEDVVVIGTDNDGRNAKDLMSNLKSVGDILKSLDSWEESVKKEKDNSVIRKGVEIDKYNE